MRIQQVITSQNCTIEWNGIEVGYIQNMTINCSYNLQPIKNLHQFEIQHYAQGISIYNATAQRAFVNLTDTIFGGKTGLVELYNLSKDIKNGLAEESSATDKFKAIASAGLLLNKGIKFALDTVNDIGNMLQGKRNDDLGLSDLFSLYDYFDIKIKNPIIEIPLFDIATEAINKLIGSQTNLITLEGCKFNARTITLSTANVAVMENITIVAKKLNDYVNTIQPQ